MISLATYNSGTEQNLPDPNWKHGVAFSLHANTEIVRLRDGGEHRTKRQDGLRWSTSYKAWPAADELRELSNSLNSDVLVPAWPFVHEYSEARTITGCGYVSHVGDSVHAGEMSGGLIAPALVGYLTESTGTVINGTESLTTISAESKSPANIVFVDAPLLVETYEHSPGQTFDVLGITPDLRTKPTVGGNRTATSNKADDGSLFVGSSLPDIARTIRLNFTGDKQEALILIDMFQRMAGRWGAFVCYDGYQYRLVRFGSDELRMEFKNTDFFTATVGVVVLNHAGEIE